MADTEQEKTTEFKTIDFSPKVDPDDVLSVFRQNGFWFEEPPMFYVYPGAILPIGAGAWWFQAWRPDSEPRWIRADNLTAYWDMAPPDPPEPAQDAF